MYCGERGIENTNLLTIIRLVRMVPVFYVYAFYLICSSTIDHIWLYTLHIIFIERAKQAPHWDVQSRFRVTYICVSMSVVSKMRRQNYVAHVHT